MDHKSLPRKNRTPASQSTDMLSVKYNCNWQSLKNSNLTKKKPKYEYNSNWHSLKIESSILWEPLKAPGKPLGISEKPWQRLGTSWETVGT